MNLTLEIVGPRAEQLGAAAHMVFAGQGGTIGRAADNDWVIPDAYISGHHARIHCRDGKYYLEDTSTNGVFIKSPGNRLAKGQIHTLQSGDRFFIDTFEIRATLAGQSIANGLASDAELDMGDVFASTQQLSPGGPAPSLEGGLAIGNQASNTDFMRLFGLDQSKSSQNTQSEELVQQLFSGGDAVPDRTAPMSEPPGMTFDEWFAAEKLASSAGKSADNKAQEDKPLENKALENKAQGNKPDLRLVPPAQKSPGAQTLPPNTTATHWILPDPADTASMRSVLIGAGFPEGHLTPELADEFGRVLRIVVSGLMDVLHESSHIKEAFRLRVTTIKPADNNPLKFSANVEDALHNLFIKRNDAFLGPVDAFDDAFEDIRNRQMAMLVAMRVAFDSMISRFDPDRLENQFDKQVARGGFFSKPAKLRYWELYQEMHRNTVKDSEKSFRELFGEEFAKAYESQLQRLRSAQKRPTK